MSTATASTPDTSDRIIQTPDDSTRMSYEEFLAWVSEEVRAEWVNGEVIIHVPPKTRHQRLVRFLLYVLHTFTRYLELGEVIEAPFEVKLWSGGPAREPDLMYVAHEQAHRLGMARFEGAPDLVIEVVSADSERRDRLDKFDEYERAGVREYWIIDNRPEIQRAWFYRLGTHGQFERVIPGEDGIYHSAVLDGLWLRLDWLWQESPDALQAVAALIGPAQMAEALRRSLED